MLNKKFHSNAFIYCLALSALLVLGSKGKSLLDLKATDDHKDAEKLRKMDKCVESLLEKGVTESDFTKGVTLCYWKTTEKE